MILNITIKGQLYQTVIDDDTVLARLLKSNPEAGVLELEKIGYRLSEHFPLTRIEPAASEGLR